MIKVISAKGGRSSECTACLPPKRACWVCTDPFPFLNHTCLFLHLKTTHLLNSPSNLPSGFLPLNYNFFFFLLFLLLFAFIFCSMYSQAITFCFFSFFFSSSFFLNFIFKLYIIVLVLPNIKMNPPQVYMRSPS